VVEVIHIGLNDAALVVNRAIVRTVDMDFSDTDGTIAGLEAEADSLGKALGMNVIHHQIDPESLPADWSWDDVKPKADGSAWAHAHPRRSRTEAPNV